jgi:DNA polymerase III subunit epsilon
VSPLHWPEQSLAGFDVESTSKISTEARIVTASVIVRHGRDVTVREWLADPGVEIPDEAAGIHGITTERAREHGRPIAEVTVEIAEQITKIWAEGMPIVIYNTPYDLQVLHCELIRHCGSPQGLFQFGSLGHVIDPLVIDKAVDKYRPGSRKLVDTCQYYGIELTEAHSAAADTLATMRLAWKLGTRYPEIGSAPLVELQARQQEWYREQQTSFATYLLEKIMPGVEPSERSAIQEKADDVMNSADGWPMKITKRSE